MTEGPNLPDGIVAEAENAVTTFLRQKKTVALAESCTGGLCTAALTEIPGASAVLLCGYTVYSNEAKQRDLGVSAETLKRYGAVSEETVAEMLKGLIAKTGCSVAGAVSGIAGPDGGTPAKPVGTVFIGTASATGRNIVRFLFSGDRAGIRRQAVETLLRMLVRQPS